MECVLVIGHTKKSPGAKNKKRELTEFDFNDDLARRIERKVKDANIQKVYRITYIGLPDQINSINPDFIISLHCNAFNNNASGTEVLYWHNSPKGKHIASILQRHLVKHLRLPDRKIKPVKGGDRGGLLLCLTKAPCVISEPFFIDNDSDLDRALEDLDGLVQAYADAIQKITEYLELIQPDSPE